jgi:hypothetical protein
MNKLKNLLIGALLGVCAQAYAGPTLSVAATPNPAPVGSSVDLDVMINDINDLYTYQFTLNFNAALFQATGVTEGAFLGTAGATFGDTGVIDNAAGTISFVFNTLLGPTPGASGSGSLALITFQAINAGSSALAFSDVLFLDSAAADIAVDAVTGTLQAVPEPATFLLFGAGLVAVGAMRRRQVGA